MAVFITDYVIEPDLEIKILKNQITTSPLEAKVLLVWHQKIDAAYLNKFPNLVGIVRYGVGYDAIEMEAIRDRNLIFCNTPDYGTDEVSDTVIAMIMNIARGVTIYDFNCRNFNDGSWQENTESNIVRTSDINLGVIGAGRIGGSILRKSKSLSLNCSFFDPFKDRGYEKLLGVSRYDSLDELIEKSDIVSINTPLTEKTKGMVDSNFVRMMKHGSSLINSARGEIIKDLDIFYQPLKNNELNSLALDVLPTEPPEDSKLIRAWRNRESWLGGRLIINPHTSYYSSNSFIEMRTKAAENANRILLGKTPFNIIYNFNEEFC